MQSLTSSAKDCAVGLPTGCCVLNSQNPSRYDLMIKNRGSGRRKMAGTNPSGIDTWGPEDLLDASSLTACTFLATIDSTFSALSLDEGQTGHNTSSNTLPRKSELTGASVVSSR